ncbi:MAG: glycosyltransferase family 39 protein [Anaerolineae bacterium]
MKRDKGLFFLLIAYLILASWYNVTIPLGEAPDEAPHYSLIRYVARERGYPTGEEEHEAFQPPLYYALGGLVTFWIDTDDFVIKANSDFSFTDPEAPQNLLLHTSAESFPYRGWALAWHLVRLLSVIMGAITVGATYALAREISPPDPSIALGSAALNAFIPAYLFISSVANNDNLATMLSSLILLLMVRGVKAKMPLGAFLLVGFLLGLGVLTKVSLLALLPTLVLALALAARSRDLAPRLKWGAKMVGAVFLPFLLVSGPWFLRNQTLYGDPLGWAQVLRLNALREGPLGKEEWLDLLVGLYHSFWLAWVEIELDTAIYALLALGVIISLGGLGVLILRRRGFEPPTPILLSLLGLHTLLVFVGLLRWSIVVLGTGQARLLYPALSPILIFLFLGGRQWVSREHGMTLAYGVGVGMLLLALITPTRYITPLYTPPPTLTPSEVERIEHQTNLDFGDQIRLLGYELRAREISPGETILLSLYWQPLRDIERDYWLLLQVVDESGQPLLIKDGSPSAGRYATDLWKEGEIIPSRHRLQLPPEVHPGPYRIEIGIHLFGAWEWLPIIDQEGKVWGEKMGLTEISVSEGE